jgi:hypothetical protein
MRSAGLDDLLEMQIVLEAAGKPLPPRLLRRFPYYS